MALLTRFKWRRNKKFQKVSIFGLGLVGAGVLCVTLIGHSIATSELAEMPSADTSYAEKMLAKTSLSSSDSKYEVDVAKLKGGIERYINKQPGRASVYFEYLPDGNFFAINSSDRYRTASLMKVPAVMQLYRSEELGRLDTKEERTVKPEYIDADFGELGNHGAGTVISFEKAAEASITNSDNTAVNLIIYELRSLNEPQLDIYNRLRIRSQVTSKDKEVEANVSSYSAILRCLYFSCFTNQENSNHILEMMTHTKVSHLRSALPEDTTVADKFGVLPINPSATLFHDCGIVYAGKGDYILCTMSEMPPENIQQTHEAISRLAYDAVQHAKSRRD